MKRIAFLLLIGLLTSCNGAKKISQQDAMAELAGEYQVISLGTQDMTGQSMSLKFDPETMAIGGSSSCNKIFGTYTAEGNTISLSSMGMTKMYCQGKMEVEKDYMQALQAVNKYRLNGAQLQLLNNQTVLITLTQAN